MSALLVPYNVYRISWLIPGKKEHFFSIIHLYHHQKKPEPEAESEWKRNNKWKNSTSFQRHICSCRKKNLNRKQGENEKKMIWNIVEHVTLGKVSGLPVECSFWHMFWGWEDSTASKPVSQTQLKYIYATALHTQSFIVLLYNLGIHYVLHGNPSGTTKIAWGLNVEFSMLAEMQCSYTPNTAIRNPPVLDNLSAAIIRDFHVRITFLSLVVSQIVFL